MTCPWYRFSMWFKYIFLFLFIGCSGYRFTQQDNPLAQYGIDSLSVPMFYNYSNQSEVSASFTKEVYRLLTQYTGLKLKSGYSTSTDAVMIGIVKSPEQVYETLSPDNLRVANDRAARAIGNRRGSFYIPGTTNVSLFLHVIVLKKPTPEQLSLVQSGYGEQLLTNSKVIFNEIIPLRAEYTREIFDGDSVAITATQNTGLQRKVIQSMAEQAAQSVKEMIFYAF